MKNVSNDTYNEVIFMDRIYNRAEDKNCANIIVYIKESDTKAYIDKACTAPYKSSELKNAFMKGCIIVTNDNEMLYPIGIGVYTDGDDGVETTMLIYVATDGAEGQLKFKTLNSVVDS